MIMFRKHLRSLITIVAMVATLFGLVQAPLTASAMHAGMMDGFDADMLAPEMFMTPAFMSVDASVAPDCVGEACPPDTACLQHCLEQATLRDAEAVLTTQTTMRVPVKVSRTVLYLEEDEDPVSVHALFVDTGEIGRLLTTHKRE